LVVYLSAMALVGEASKGKMEGTSNAGTLFCGPILGKRGLFCGLAQHLDEALSPKISRTVVLIHHETSEGSQAGFLSSSAHRQGKYVGAMHLLHFRLQNSAHTAAA